MIHMSLKKQHIRAYISATVGYHFDKLKGKANKSTVHQS